MRLSLFIAIRPLNNFKILTIRFSAIYSTIFIIFFIFLNCNAFHNAYPELNKFDNMFFHLTYITIMFKQNAKLHEMQNTNLHEMVKLSSISSNCVEQ